MPKVLGYDQTYQVNVSARLDNLASAITTLGSIFAQKQKKNNCGERCY